MNIRYASALAACIAGLISASTSASAAEGCPVPGEDWQQVEPESMGMDADKLQQALDYGTSRLGFAIRVYRHGCLVGADQLEPLNDETRFESFSMSKSIVALLFGRAMTLGLISPDDPVGSLIPEADRDHGEITMIDLLTMSSGLRWNFFRDYNVFTTQDRVRDALTLPVVHEPGTWYEYAQSAVSLLVEAIERATGMDAQEFIQRRLFNQVGIEAGSWRWQRDPAGNIQGFWGAGLRVDDYARLGELLRRGGVWKGRRLLSREFVTRATSPAATNGCYGWLIWVNAGAPCIGATVADRPVSEERQFPGLPSDQYNFSGLFGQVVAVFPSQGLVIVRTGQDPGPVPVYGEDWLGELFRRVLAAITDQRIPISGPAKPSHEEPETDYGFFSSLQEPEQFVRVDQDPLPPAGPRRARAAQLELTRLDTRRGVLRVRLSCPPRWPGSGPSRCAGDAVLGRDEQAYDVRAGGQEALRWRVSNPRRRRLAVIATNRDQAGGTGTTLVVPRRRG